MLATDDATPEIRPGFWKRQFQNPVTNPQVVFDAILGTLIIPAIPEISANHIIEPMHVSSPG